MNHVLPRCSIQSDQTKSPILGGLFQCISSLYPIRNDQTKAPILGRLSIVPPIYIKFISPIEKVKYLLVHYKEELKILHQISIQVGCLVSAIVNKEDES